MTEAPGVVVPIPGTKASEVTTLLCGNDPVIETMRPLIPESRLVTLAYALIADRKALAALTAQPLHEEGAVAWRIRAGLGHPLVEDKPFDWRLSESRPEYGDGAKAEWFDLEPLYTRPFSVNGVGGPAGEYDDCLADQGRLSGNPGELPAQPVAGGEAGKLRIAVSGIADDYQTSEAHHPDHVLIPKAKFDAIAAALQSGEGS